MKKIFSLILVVLVMAACGEKNVDSNKQETPEITQDDTKSSDDWQSNYDRIDPNQLPDNPIQLIGTEWMLITGGDKSGFNTMTASWGGIGYIWEKPVAFTFVRNTRFTYQFLEKNNGFTLSFFTEDYRGALKICGSKSGRDSDKIKEAGITAIETPSGLMSFKEARMIIECKKMFVQELDLNHLDKDVKESVIADFYKGDAAKHQQYISEITNIWIKK